MRRPSGGSPRDVGTALRALAPVLLYALAREADRGLGLVLRAEMEPDGLLAEVGRAMVAGGAAAAVRVALWTIGGAVGWLALAGWRRRREETAWASALAAEAAIFTPLLLRPATTIVALLSVARSASYPYGSTLPVALTQDWAVAQDWAVLAALVASRLPAFRLPAPRAAEVFALVFLAYAVLVPDWAWRWDGHPGNEPKYLRQAVALGHGLTFDAEGVSAAMEDLPTRPLSESVAVAAGAFVRESWSMLGALGRGEVGRDAIRATRITRQTVQGKEGGVFYVLAPGPSLMLAPALRVDRAINLARGRPGRVAVSVLVWCALAALLVTALFLLVRDATGRAGLAAILAFGFALVPPFLFYFFQFYPEMVGALVMAFAFRTLALRTAGLRRHPWLFGGLLATLPWLHQKFLPVWLALVATALWVGWRSPSREASSVPGPGAKLRVGEPAGERGGSAGVADSPGPVQTVSRGMTRPAWRWAVGLVVPTLAGLYLTALYNFAITGSVRPDALFLAWGPGGVTSERVGQGVLGLLLDARYGILPYVPILLLAAGGLVLGGARRFAVVVPAAAVYYLTVASADNWAGAVCNLGRYFMPVAPLAVALVGIAIDRAVSSQGTRLPPESKASPGAGAPAVGREGSAGAETADPSGPVTIGVSRDDGARRGALALVLMLAVWTALLAVALWRDPHAANDSALLLAKSTYADGNQYVPNLFIRQWSDGAPGLWARVAAWLAALGAAGWWLRRVAASSQAGRGRRGGSPIVVLVTVAVLMLGVALFLERWPGRRAAASFADRITIRDATPHPPPPPGVSAVLLSGAARVREDEAIVDPGSVELLFRSPGPATSLRVTVGGQGSVLRAIGVAPLVLRPTGALLDLPLFPYHEVRGRGGRKVAFSRTTLVLDGEAILRLGEGEMEPQPGGAR
jgi:hypothetical protein